MSKGDTVGAYGILRHWYKKFSKRGEKPSKVDLDIHTEKYRSLFTADNLTDETPFPIHYSGNPVFDGPPNEEEVRQALFKMRNRKSPGFTNMTVEDIKKWYELSHPDLNKNPNIQPDEDALYKWDKLMILIRKCIIDGDVPEAFTLGILVLIPKNDAGDVRGIGLLDVIHKLISTIINKRLSDAIEFCDSVHGFRKKRGGFTAIGET